MTESTVPPETAQHTPGEWRVEHGFGADWGITSSEPNADGGYHIARVVREADARLIAAAPDMLDALRSAHRELEDGDALEAVCDAITAATGVLCHDEAVRS